MDERFHAYTSGKGVVDESINSESKRKSSGQGQSSKNPKVDDALQSWQRSCEARERFYLQAEANAGAADAYSVAAFCEKLGHPTIWFEVSGNEDARRIMSSSRPNERQSNNMYNPYSDDGDDVMDLHMDCIGTIDGTHVVVVAPEGDQMPYRGRKVHTTQNVMAACSFDMKFTFVYTGWEGSAHDSRIFLKALTTNSADFSHPPPNKHYLVDVGYTHMPGYVAPYRGKKYHLQEFNRRRRYHGPQELFNHRHSSLRNVIERTFGVLKQRFPLLRHMSRYDMIRTVQEQDEFFDAEESSDENEDDVEDEDEDEGDVLYPCVEVYVAVLLAN
ncbi:uncharacterized protein LOC114311010 [Camellia sinensis]|uniref:uncharacterized protein LOC114311010 n=1 Tax=Camellia sinensis TaxID=4442 RepID=UPI0010368187|nr:uncharacterized protein LOC114311010 [Camellia sinensis]